jgi:hypothetical protein
MVLSLVEMVEKTKVYLRILRMAWLGLFGCLILVPGQAAPSLDQPMPSQDFIMGRVWRNLELQDFTLSGILRTGSRQHALRLVTGGRSMNYIFPDDALDIKVRFLPDETEVLVKEGDKPERRWGANDWQRTILETDITYEEVALRFLYWPEIRVAGVDSIKTLKAYAFDTEPGTVASQFARVRFWISAEHFALLRADAYDAGGQVVKRLEVNGVLQIGDAWVLKELQVATLIPGRDISRTRTYIDIRDGRSGKEQGKP